MNLNKRLKAAALAFTCLLPAGCSINPASGTPDVVMRSETAELELGKETHEKILASTPIYKDEALQRYVEALGRKIARHSDRPDLTYHFTIIDEPNINAFALPGGYIYVNRGLLAYLNSEAQLAAVLSHEIGHIAARHSVRQEAAKTGASLLSVITILATGNAVLTDMSSLWSTAAVKGYGREMELEADQYGAIYMHRSGYSPQAMIETIGVLKDQEKFSRYKSKKEGKKQRSYHGLFSTHPRNDIRLKTVVKQAGTLSPEQLRNDNIDIYRQKVEGMVYGVNYPALIKKNKPLDENRYTHDKLRFTLLFPDDWQVQNKRSSILGQPDDHSANIELEVRALKKPITPTQYIRQEMKIPLLKRSESFKQYGYIGHTGLVSNNGKPDKRVAAFFQGRKVYLFTGTVNQPQAGVNYDELFMRSIKSFRPAQPKRKIPKAKTIHYVKATDKTTFAQLARLTRIGHYPEQQLRLINGYYPRGEPKAGAWIKIIK